MPSTKKLIFLESSSLLRKKTNCLDAIRDRVNMLNRFNRWTAMQVIDPLLDVLQIHFSSLSLNKNGSIGFDFQVAGPLNALLTANCFRLRCLATTLNPQAQLN